ncbi:5-formyltetrahydrofolate cyclo-ligase [Sporolactobacillus sp. THM7-4]|nr:5-formyltetrahydrofolate cyclo-ligase [Sporolactobacillus sp. THM7-4]
MEDRFLMNIAKKQYREHILDALKKLDAQTFENKCTRIRKFLFSEEEWLTAKTVAVTLSVGREIETRPIIKRAWAQGKQVAVPKCNPKTKQLTFYRLDSFDQLEKSFYGLMEPNPDKTCPLESSELDLIIVPGVAFDPRGYRIGYGGGYYDRFLSGNHGKTVSLLLNCQMIERVPEESFDQRVTKLITERGVVPFSIDE